MLRAIPPFLRGRKGGGKYKNTPDTIRSEDSVEVILGVGEGENYGLAEGAKSFRIGGTALVNSNDEPNFKDFQLTEYTGLPNPPAIIPALGGFGSPIPANASSLAVNTAVVRTGQLTNIDYLDLRFLINQLHRSDDKGIYTDTLTIKIEYRQSLPAGQPWVLAWSQVVSPPPGYDEDTSTPGVNRYTGGWSDVDYHNDIVTFDGDNLYMRADEVAPSEPIGNFTNIWMRPDDGYPHVYDPGTGGFVPAPGVVDNGTSWTYGSTKFFKNPATPPPNPQIGDVWTPPNTSEPLRWNGTSWIISLLRHIQNQAYAQPMMGQANGILTMNQKVTSPTVREVRVPVPRADVPYDIRVTKLSPDTSNDGKKVSEVGWESFEEIVAEGRSFPNTHILHIIGRASDQFNSLPELTGDIKGRVVQVPTNYDPVTRTYSGVWDGLFKYAWTDNGAWCTRDFIKNNRYGLSTLYPYEVREANFYNWAVWCDQAVPDNKGGSRPRWTYNDVLDQPRQAKEQANYMAGSSGGRLIDDGSGVYDVLVDRDEPMTMVFGPESVVDGEFTYSFTDIQTRANWIKVGFVNPDLNWEVDFRVIKDDDHIEEYGRIPLEFVATGKINVSEALSAARLRLITGTTEYTAVTFQTNRVGKYLFPFKIIGVCDPDMGWGISGRLVEVTGPKQIRLRDPVYLEAGIGYKFVINRATSPITTVSMTVAPGQTGSLTTINFVEDLPADLPEFAQFAVESYAANGDPIGTPKAFKILTITPGDGDSELVEITALELNRAKWAYVDGTGELLPAEEYTSFQGPITKPQNVTITPTTETVGGVTKRNLQIEWDQPTNPFARNTIVEYSRDGNNFVKVGESETEFYEVRDVSSGVHTVRLMHIHTDGVRKSLPVLALHEITSEFRNVPPVDDLVLADEAAPTIFQSTSPMFRWAHGEEDPNFRTYRVRIRDAGTNAEKRVEDVAIREFIYDFDKNKVDFAGTPARAFKVCVSKVDDYDNESPEEVLSVTNFTPAAPVFTVETDLNGYTVKIAPPAEKDVIGALVWAEEASGYNPAVETPVAEGNQQVFSIPASLDGPPLFVRVAYYDPFGKVGLNVAAEQETRTTAEVDELKDLIDNTFGFAEERELVEQLAATTAAAAQTAETAASTASTAASNASAAYTLTQGALTDAQAARDAAEAAMDEATSQATAAGASASTAAGHASTASTAAGNAGSSASAADLARTQAQAARDDAQGFAGAASTSASTASAQATLAGERATAAQTAQTAAETARGQAQTYASNAAASESNSAGHASQAASNAGVSATIAASLLPENFTQDGRFWTGYWYVPSPAGNNIGDVSPNIALTYPSVTDAGKVLQIQSNGYVNSTRFGQLATIPLVAGRKYRVSMRWRVLTNSTTSTGGDYTGGAHQLLTMAVLFQESGLYNIYSPTPWYSRVAADGWGEYSHVYDSDAMLAYAPSATKARFTISAFYGSNGAVVLTNGAIQIAYLRVIDVTSELAAAGSASAAAGSASTASAAQTAAGQSATAAQTAQTQAETARGQAQTAAANAAASETNAAGSASSASSSALVSASAGAAARLQAAYLFPRDFQNSGSTWGSGIGSGWDVAPSAITPLSVSSPANIAFPTDPVFGKVLRVTGNVDMTDVFPVGAVKVEAGRKYRFSARVRAQEWGSGPQIDMYVVGLNSSYQYIAGVNDARSFVASTLEPTTGSPGASNWLTLSFIPDTSGWMGGYGVVYVRPLLRFRKLNAYTNVYDAQFLAVEDVTESEAAGSSATASAASASQALAYRNTAGEHASSASTQANNASTSAGQALAYRDQAATSSSNAAGYAVAAQSSANLAASVSISSLLQNPRFNSFLYAVGLPTGWNDWSYGAYTERVAGEQPGQYAARLTGTVGQAVGISAYTSINPRGLHPEMWVVLSARVKLVSGTFDGAAAYFVARSSEGSGLEDLTIHFKSEIGAGNVGQIYSVSAMKKLTHPLTAYGHVYAMAHWGSATGGISANTNVIDWYECSVRPATAAEIELGVARSSSPTLSARISDVASVAAAATAAVATRTTTLEARTSGTSPNLVVNPSGNDGLTGWDSLGSRPWLTYADLTWGQWFSSRLDSESSASAVLRSKPISPAGYGYQYTFQGQIFLSGYTGGGYVDIGLYSYTDAEGTTGEARLGGHGINTIYGNSPGRVVLPPITVTTASSARSIRVWLQAAGTNWASYAHVGFWGLKLEQGTVATTFSDDASTRALNAKITETASVLATLEGRVEATAGLTVQAGNRIAGMRFHAVDGTDVNYSSISFLADVLQVWDSVNSQGIAPFEVRNGGIRARAAMIDRLAVGASLTVGTANLRVAVQPFDLSVTDGVPVSFGYDLGYAPTLTFIGNNLVAIGSGETALLYADNLTSTGFTPRLKYQTPGTPTNYTHGPGSPSTGTISGVSVLYYQLTGGSTSSVGVRGRGYVRSYFYNDGWAGGGGPYEADENNAYSDGYMTMAVFAYNGSSWSQIGTISAYPAFRMGGNSWSSSAPGYYDDYFDITEYFAVTSNITHIALGVQYETYAESYLSDLHVSYQVQSAGGVRSATPNGQLSTVTVRPRT